MNNTASHIEIRQRQDFPLRHFPYLLKSELLAAGVDDNTIRRGLTRNRKNKTALWAHKKQAGNVYLDYHSLSERVKKQVAKHYTGEAEADLATWVLHEYESSQNAQEGALKAEIFQPVSRQHPDVLYFAQGEYRMDYDESKGYVYAARTLDLLADTPKSASGCYLRTGFTNKKALYDAVISIFESYEHPAIYFRSGSKLNQRRRTLQDKTKVWRKHAGNRPMQLRSLVHRQRGMVKNSKFSEAHKMFCAQLYVNAKDVEGIEVQKLSKTEIHRWYKRWCKERGDEAAGVRTVQDFLQKEAIQYAKGRHGWQHEDNQLRPYMKRLRPSPFGTVTGDGIVLNRPVKYEYTRNGKKMYTTSQLVIWIWYDWHTETILSSRIAPLGKGESGELLRQSFRDILNFWGGLCPHSVQIDKSWAQDANVKTMFENAGVFVMPKKAYNPKASFAERLNRELKRQHKAYDAGWVTFRKFSADNRPNPDQLKAPMSEAEARRLWLDIQQVYNPQPIDDQCVLAGLNASKKYTYNFPAYQYKELKGSTKPRVRVKFDERDMETVQVFAFADEANEAKDVWLASVSQTAKFNASVLEWTKDDAKAYQKQKEHRDQYDAWQENEEEYLELASAAMDVSLGIEKVGQDRYKEALEAQEANAMRKYYEDLDRASGKKVETRKPTGSEKKSAEQRRRERLNNLYNDDEI